MKNLGIFAALSVGLCAALSAGTGCSSSSSGTGATTTTTTSPSTSSSSGSSTSSSGGTGGTGGTTTTTTNTNPAPPTIGMQIDRMGRPAINTALNHAFDSTAAAGTAKDKYNQDSTPAGWAAAYAPDFAKSLAILDSLDTNCGNQLLAGAAGATRYATLAGALADDRLWLNTAGPTCAAYLAVEANAVGVLVNTDCGGRGLAYDVIDTSYSALAAGVLTGVGDGVPANDVAFLTAFPYLAAPH